MEIRIIKNAYYTDTEPIIIIIIIIIIIEYMHTDRRGNNRRQKCRAKGSGKEVKIQEFRYRDTTNVEPEMYDYTSYNWNHWNSNEKLKKKSGSYSRKTFDRFTTEVSYTWIITHNAESTAVWNLKPEWWGSPLGSREVPGRKGL
jgi:hypothetical protein